MSAAPAPSPASRVSVIVCSRRSPADVRHERDVAATVGVPHEYVRIDNRDGRYGICAAYNLGVERAAGEVLVFVHEDVWFRSPDWGAVLLDKFEQHPEVGLVGVMGSQRLIVNNPTWAGAGMPFNRGRLVTVSRRDGTELLAAMADDGADDYVIVVDGLFMAIRATLFDRVRFDNETFRGFHQYDVDISQQVARTHRLLVTRDILVKHDSRGDFDAAWAMDAALFVKKWGARAIEDCRDQS